MLHLVKGLRKEKKRILLGELIERTQSACKGKYLFVSTGGNDKQSVAKSDYLCAPCAKLPKPFGVCGGSASGYKRVAGEGLEAHGLPEGAFFRLYRKLGDMQRMRSDNYSVRGLFISEDADDLALAGSMAGTAEQVIAIERLSTDPASDRLSAAVHSRASGECICCGFAGSDAETGEGWIAALLIPSPNDEAALLLVNELLRRLSSVANFATVCVPAGDAALVRILRKSGFSGGDAWVKL